MHANALEATPGPARATVQAVVKAILSPQLPLVANIDPATTVPPLVGAHAILVPTDTPVSSSPEPAASPVVVVLPPQVPVGANTTPMAIVVALQGAQAVAMHSNAPEAAPDPALAAVQFVAEMVTANEFPVSADPHPPDTSPAFMDAETIQVVIDPAVFAPEPFVWPVVVVPPPHMPVRAHLTPAALHVAVQGAAAVAVHADALVSTPAPLLAPVMPVVVVITAIQMPVLADHDPPTTIPALERRR